MSIKGKFVSDRYTANYFLQMNTRRKNIKMCPYGAWHWLLHNAAFKDHPTQYHGETIHIKRGQVPTSWRRLQEAFNWDYGRLNRFLSEAETQGFIKTETETGFLVITICNYNEIQKFNIGAETEKNTKKKGKSETNRTKGKKNNKSIDEEVFNDVMGGQQ